MKLPNFRKTNSSKGFTLIELLVVIGILGILAAGLLLTIDPLEKFRQGNDTNIQQGSTDLYNALTAYYSTHQAFPWDATTAGGDGCNGAAAPSGLAAYDTGTGTVSDCITALITAGELKSTYTSDTNMLKQMFISLDATSNLPSVCFAPQSKSMQNNSSTKYDQAGGAWASGTKYWCAK